jgi:hypothetical protein
MALFETIPWNFGDGSDGAAVLDGVNTYPWAVLAQVYTFTVSPANASGSNTTYTNNGQTFTVLKTLNGGTTLVTMGTGAPTASGTLTFATGIGDAAITFSSFTSAASLYIQIQTVFLTNLTINSGITLLTQSMGITGNGILTNAGMIDNSGYSGLAGGVSDGSYVQGEGGFGGAPGGVAVVPYNTINSTGPGLTGATGATGTTTTGANGNLGTASAGPLNSDSGTSGDGGSGTSGAGGTGVLTILTGAQASFRDLVSNLIQLATILSGAASGSGGAAGAGDLVNDGGGGGGGGSSGGVVGIWFDTINNTGVISSNGGAGGPGESPATGDVGGGGGGSGAAGGFIYSVARNWIAAGTMQVNGGAGGAGGAGSGAGTAGTAGTAGDVGLSLRFNIHTGLWF